MTARSANPWPWTLTSQSSNRTVSGASWSRVRTFGGSVRRLAITLAASWLPVKSTTGVPASCSRPISWLKKSPVEKSRHGPS